jgi:hypothetical protein
MSLFEYAEEVVSRKLEREKPMLSVSMGMQPVMPMAQGGGLSSVQNSLNINGQPHRLAYINPNEEDLLKSLGGSGRKIDGIPAYYEGHGAGEGTSEEGATGEGEDSGTGDGPGAGADAGGSDNPDTFDVPNISYSVPEATFDARASQNLGPPDTFSVNPATIGIGLMAGPVAAAIANAIGIGKSTSFDVAIPGSGTPGGYGDTGTGNQGGSGQPGDDADDDGDDSGGDDIIIKEKIAAVKEVPVEDVSDADVARVRQTAEERIAGTNIEDIIRQMYGVARANRLLNINRPPTEQEEKINHRADLIDSIYGPGSSAGLLGITTNNTGTA